MRLILQYFLQGGGRVYPGDKAKSFGAGADFVMLVGMLSGQEESPGALIEENGKYKIFHGSHSITAKENQVRKYDMFRFRFSF